MDRIQTGIQGIEHRTRHRHAKMRIDHRRRIRQHYRDRIAGADTALHQRRRQTACARIFFRPGDAQRAVDHRQVLRINAGRTLNERYRRQRRVIGLIPVEVQVVLIHVFPIGLIDVPGACRTQGIL